MVRLGLPSVLLSLGLMACGPTPEAPLPDAATPASPDAAAANDAGASADAGTAADAGVADAATPSDAGTDKWAEVDRIAAEAIAAEGSEGVGLAIYDAEDRLVFQRMYGDFAPDRRVAVASASKAIAGSILFELIDRGLLTLDSTTGEVLGWTGANQAITLRHLLSFTSGLEREARCTSQIASTLAECVDEIRDAPVVTPPGERFDYGSTHLHVAARMAEVVTGQTFNALFREVLADPLGLDPEVQYYTFPRQARGVQNPLVAGGLRANLDEYAALWAVTFHRGAYRDLSIGTPDLFDAQTREPFPSAVIGASPAAAAGLPFRYGLAAWLECTAPAAGCAEISSPGAFGWTPWLDRDGGYYAILGTESATSGPGVVVFTVNLAQTLKPAILRALAQ